MLCELAKQSDIFHENPELTPPGAISTGCLSTAAEATIAESDHNRRSGK